MDAGTPVTQQSQVPDFVVSEQELDELQKLTETIARAAVSDANAKVGRPIPVSSPSTLTSETIVSEENGPPRPTEFPKEEMLQSTDQDKNTPSLKGNVGNDIIATYGADYIP